MSLRWSEPYWKKTLCIKCGRNIWDSGGDPDWGLCLECFDKEQNMYYTPEENKMRKANRNPAIQQQSMPQGSGENIHDLLIEDIKKRKELGEKKYGEPLKAFNGRNALIDAYQEVLDLAVYLRQEIEEREQLIELLLDVISAACTVKCEDGFVLDSMEISSYADAIIMLNKLGKVEITYQKNDRVIAKLKEKNNER